MNLLDRAKAQGCRDEVRALEVPEWGDNGQPFVIYYQRPSLDHLASSIEAGHAKNPIRQNVDIFCQLAKDADGKPLCNRIDGAELMKSADPLVLGRIMREMGIIDGASDVEQEKN